MEKGAWCVAAAEAFVSETVGELCLVSKVLRLTKPLAIVHKKQLRKHASAGEPQVMSHEAVCGTAGRLRVGMSMKGSAWAVPAVSCTAGGGRHVP